MRFFRNSIFRRHTKDLVIVLLTAAAGIGVVTYVLSQQVAAPSFLRSGGGDGYSFKAEFSDVSGIVAGKGQPVTVAGVQVGTVGDVQLEEGVAVVTFDLDSGENEPEVYSDATLLVRPRTALKDMSIALEPGTESAGEIPDGEAISVSQTQPSVDVEDVLSNLDVDARSYMRLLLSGGAGAFRDGETATSPGEGVPSAAAVSDLNQSIERLEPLAEDARLVTELLGKRRANLRRAVDGLEQITVELTSVGSDISSLIDGAQRTFAATGSRDAELAAALSELPSTLAQTDRALKGTADFGRNLRVSAGNLQPLARSLGPALRELRPFFTETGPIFRDRLAPFSVSTLPVVKSLKFAASKIAPAVPKQLKVAKFLNELLNGLAYNPPGTEEGYLFWASWLAHIGNSLTSVQDANGAAIRGLPLATCSQLDAVRQVELGNPSLSPIIKLINLADRLVVCRR